METSGNSDAIQALDNFLKESEKRQPDDFTGLSLSFHGITYAWRSNQSIEKPKSLDEFLKTTIYNGAAKRFGLKVQKGDPQAGQPELEIQMTPENTPDAFYLEIYHWEYGPDSGTPEPIIPRLAALSGIPSLPQEKTFEYFKRLAAEKKAIFQEEEGQSAKMVIFEVPLSDIPGIVAVGKIEAPRKDVEVEGKKEVKYGMKEITLDIKIPYNIIGVWLEGQKG